MEASRASMDARPSLDGLFGRSPALGTSTSSQGHGNSIRPQLPRSTSSASLSKLPSASSSMAADAGDSKSRTIPASSSGSNAGPGPNASASGSLGRNAYPPRAGRGPNHSRQASGGSRSLSNVSTTSRSILGSASPAMGGNASINPVLGTRGSMESLRSTDSTRDSALPPPLRRAPPSGPIPPIPQGEKPLLPPPPPRKDSNAGSFLRMSMDQDRGMLLLDNVIPLPLGNPDNAKSGGQQQLSSSLPAHPPSLPPPFSVYNRMRPSEESARGSAGAVDEVFERLKDAQVGERVDRRGSARPDTADNNSSPASSKGSAGAPLRAGSSQGGGGSSRGESPLSFHFGSTDNLSLSLNLPNTAATAASEGLGLGAPFSASSPSPYAVPMSAGPSQSVEHTWPGTGLSDEKALSPDAATQMISDTILSQRLPRKMSESGSNGAGSSGFSMPNSAAADRHFQQNGGVPATSSDLLILEKLYNAGLIPEAQLQKAKASAHTGLASPLAASLNTGGQGQAATPDSPRGGAQESAALRASAKQTSGLFSGIKKRFGGSASAQSSPSKSSRGSMPYPQGTDRKLHQDVQIVGKLKSGRGMDAMALAGLYLQAQGDEKRKHKRDRTTDEEDSTPSFGSAPGSGTMEPSSMRTTHSQDGIFTQSIGSDPRASHLGQSFGTERSGPPDLEREHARNDPLRRPSLNGLFEPGSLGNRTYSADNVKEARQHPPSARRKGHWDKVTSTAFDVPRKSSLSSMRSRRSSKDEGNTGSIPDANRHLSAKVPSTILSSFDAPPERPPPPGESLFSHMQNQLLVDPQPSQEPFHTLSPLTPQTPFTPYSAASGRSNISATGSSIVDAYMYSTHSPAPPSASTDTYDSVPPSSSVQSVFSPTQTGSYSMTPSSSEPVILSPKPPRPPRSARRRTRTGSMHSFQFDLGQGSASDMSHSDAVSQGGSGAMAPNRASQRFSGSSHSPLEDSQSVRTSFSQPSPVRPGAKGATDPQSAGKPFGALLEINTKDRPLSITSTASAMASMSSAPKGQVLLSEGESEILSGRTRSNSIPANQDVSPNEQPNGNGSAFDWPSAQANRRQSNSSDHSVASAHSLYPHVRRKRPTFGLQVAPSAANAFDSIPSPDLAATYSTWSPRSPSMMKLPPAQLPAGERQSPEDAPESPGFDVVEFIDDRLEGLDLGEDFPVDMDADEEDDDQPISPRTRALSQPTRALHIEKKSKTHSMSRQRSESSNGTAIDFGSRSNRLSQRRSAASLSESQQSRSYAFV